MIGYACIETPELMPAPIVLAHQLTRALAERRKDGTIPYLGPDGKSQVTVDYEDGTPKRVSDVNERALKLTRMNAKQFDVKIRVKKSDLFETLDSFDCILTNPPYVAGRKVIFELIEQAKDHLNPRGTLQLVARHQKGGKMLEKKMLETFGNVEILGKKAGFRVYQSVNA